MSRAARLTLMTSLLVIPSFLLAASSVTVPIPAPSAQLERALAEANAAEAEAERLERAARKARDEADRLAARQAAAAESIAAAEARISAADARARIIAAQVAERRRRLREQQEPAGALLAGLAMMAARPPLLAILDGSSTDDLVRVRLVLDSTLPAIRRRTDALAADIAQLRSLQASAESSRAAQVRARAQLQSRRREFAALEQRALRLAELRGAGALRAQDVALVRGERASSLAEKQRGDRAARRAASELAALSAAPPRPLQPASEQSRPSLAYRLPAEALVVEGFGAVSSAGIRSRGITLGTRRGMPLTAPAAGTLRFAGPFRGYDGIVIIDHGGGWTSLIINISASLQAGDRVELGQPLGRATGPLGVELSHNGRRVSPALMAGSSRMLSNRAKDG